MKREAVLVEKKPSRITYAIPVTLRQVETFEIPLDRMIGVNDAAHQKLLDDTSILRIAFGAEIDRLAIKNFVEIQCLDTTQTGKKPEWRNCLSRLLHAFGNVMLMENKKRESHIWELLGKVLPNYEEIIAGARKPFEEYVKQYKLAHPDEFEN